MPKVLVRKGALENSCTIGQLEEVAKRMGDTVGASSSDSAQGNTGTRDMALLQAASNAASETLSVLAESLALRAPASKVLGTALSAEATRTALVSLCLSDDTPFL